MPVNLDAPRVIKLAVASRYNNDASEQWHMLPQNADIEWTVLARYADTLGLAPLLFDSIRKTSGMAIPDDVNRFLEDRYHQTATFNLLAIHELSKLLKVFSPLKIPIAVLKGAALLQSVYENIALRPMVDLDLIIPFSYLAPAVDILTNAGYKQQLQAPFLNYEGLFWNEDLFVGSGISKMQVELHWNLIDNPYFARQLPTSRLISRCQVLRDSGQEFRILAPDDQLLHLCIHNAYHHQNLFERTWVDLAHVASHFEDSIDWERLIVSASACDMVQAVSTNLSIAATEWFAPIPTGVLQHLNRAGVSVRERAFMISQRSEFFKVGRTLISLPGIKPMISFAFGQIFPDRQYMIWRYGNSPSNNLLILYIKRFASGLRGLISELAGKKSVKDEG